jgi:hypothetical protein
MSSTTSRVAGYPVGGNIESPVSAVSWAAVIAGAFVAAALSMALIAAGTALGFATMSPWRNDGASATTLGVGAIIWLIVVQIASAGMGGYVAGRLRTKWVDVHSGEVFFRDTAHGLLVWAVGAVIGAVVISSAATSVIGGAAKLAGGAAAGVGGAAATAVGAAAQNAPSADYLTDTLFRRGTPDATTTASPADARAEVGRILSTSLANGEMTPEDKTQVSRIVAQQAGIDQATAEKRVNDMTEKAKATAAQAKQKAQEAADTARKAAAAAALWIFVSLLIGALSASYLATVGGRARDSIG